MNALNAHKGWPSGDLARQVRETAWLPTTGDATVAPDHVAYHAVYGDVLDCFLTAAPDAGKLVPAGRLLAWVHVSPEYHRVAKWLFPDSDKVLPRVKFSPAQRIGDITAAATDALKNWVTAFADVPGEIMPSAALIVAVFGVSSDDCGKYLWPSALGPLQAGRLVPILNWLADRYDKERGDKRAAIDRVHNLYLQLATASDLPALKLRNRNGDWVEWVEAAKLCVAEGVDERHQLDEGQQEILGEEVTEQRPRELRETDVTRGFNSGKRIEVQISDSVKALRAEFRKWEEVDPLSLGGFVAALGGGPHELGREATRRPPPRRRVVRRGGLQATRGPTLSRRGHAGGHRV